MKKSLRKKTRFVKNVKNGEIMNIYNKFFKGIDDFFKFISIIFILEFYVISIHLLINTLIEIRDYSFLIYFTIIFITVLLSSFILFLTKKSC